MLVSDGFKATGLDILVSDMVLIFILIGLLVIVTVFYAICSIGEWLKKWKDKYYEKSDKDGH